MKFTFGILAVCAIQLASVGSLGAKDLTMNLEGYWQFDSNPGDSSTNSRDLTLNGSPSFGAGLFGDGLQLTGNAAQTAQRPVDDATFNFGADDFTLQIWANFSSVASEQTLIEKFVGGAGPGWTLSKLSSNAVQFFAGGVPTINSPALSIGTDEWHHLLVRRDGSDFEMFFNGTSVATSSSAGSITTTTNPLLIGEREGAQTFPVRGTLDEVAIWSRALDNTEVAQLYNGGVGSQIAIPEPSSALALTFVLGAATALRRRR